MEPTATAELSYHQVACGRRVEVQGVRRVILK